MSHHDIVSLVVEDVGQQALANVFVVAAVSLILVRHVE